jgi:predicted DNA-binding protein (UPF0251 family)
VSGETSTITVEFGAVRWPAAGSLVVAGGLAKMGRQSAEMVKLRYFTGLKQEDVAKELGVSLRTVERLWKFSHAGLYRAVKNTFRSDP